MNRNKLFNPETEGSNGSGNANYSELSPLELDAILAETGESIQHAQVEAMPAQEQGDPAGIDLEALLESVQANIEDEHKPSFIISPETGLSLEGETIEELRVRLQGLESRQDTTIADTITESKVVERQQLSQTVEISQGKYDELLQRIQVKINQLQANNDNIKVSSIEDFISHNEQLKELVDAHKFSVETTRKSLETFDTKTKDQIDDAYNLAIKETEDQLAQLTAEYNGSDAEGHDKKVLLEQKLESLLTNPDRLFSDAYIAEILAVYGLQEGQERLQNLQEQSKEAQEQKTKDEIRTDILKNIYWTKDKIPELTQAINADIEAKLKQLQEQYPDLDTITTALKLSGTDRFAYLLNSEEPKLEQLAFWSTTYRSGNWENILAEHPQLSQYVENQVNRTFADREQTKEDFHLQREKQSQDRITNNIENGVQKYTQQEVQNLERAVQQIQNDELAESLRQDEETLESKQVLNTRKVDTFKQELTSALEAGITFEDGEFRNTFDAPTLNAEINQEIQTITQELKGYLEGLEGIDYNINSLDDLSQLSQMVQTDLATENKKFLKNHRKISAIQGAQTVIAENSKKYKQLQAQKEQNTSQWQLKMQLSKDLNTKYNESLPQYIRDKLKTVSIDNMSIDIDSAVQELQQYETPAEVKVAKDRIIELQQKIEELKTSR